MKIKLIIVAILLPNILFNKQLCFDKKDCELLILKKSIKVVYDQNIELRKDLMQAAGYLQTHDRQKGGIVDSIYLQYEKWNNINLERYD